MTAQKVHPKLVVTLLLRDLVDTHVIRTLTPATPRSFPMGERRLEREFRRALGLRLSCVIRALINEWLGRPMPKSYSD